MQYTVKCLITMTNDALSQSPATEGYWDCWSSNFYRRNPFSNTSPIYYLAKELKTKTLTFNSKAIDKYKYTAYRPSQNLCVPIYYVVKNNGTLTRPSASQKRAFVERPDVIFLPKPHNDIASHRQRNDKEISGTIHKLTTRNIRYTVITALLDYLVIRILH